ncbi:hypothetical protein GCM10010406_26770 [Streptomyces thermolineatus]|uniref:Uncharacterized protein n=1 Tax=Streptomyces thermolineatus TaxID=44033 RepID=A0ABN3LUH3_9ACTN
MIDPTVTPSTSTFASVTTWATARMRAIVPSTARPPARALRRPGRPPEVPGAGEGPGTGGRGLREGAHGQGARRGACAEWGGVPRRRRGRSGAEPVRGIAAGWHDSRHGRFPGVPALLRPGLPASRAAPPGPSRPPRSRAAGAQPPYEGDEE